MRCASEELQVRVLSPTAMAVLLASLLCCGPAVAADKVFSGEDAAHIDWAWKNCEMASTKKLHGLVDQARTKGNDAFQRGYEQQYRKIVASTPAPADAKRTCDQIRGWYGPLGTRISELIEPKVDKPSVAGTSVGSKSSSPSSGKSGGRNGGGGGKRGGF